MPSHSTFASRRSSRNSTARTRRCRRLVRDGMIRIPVVVNVQRLRDVLRGAELLAEWDEEDRQAITAAFQRAVDLWLANEERKLGNY
jgi:hypothetical protein